MKTKLFSILCVAAIIIGCNEKVPRNIDLTKFLPEENTTRYYYRTTMVDEPNYPGLVTKDMLTEKVIVSRKDHCIKSDSYVRFNKWEVERMDPNMKKHIKRNRLKGENETLCADDEKLTSSGYTFYQKDGNWDMSVESTDAKGNIEDVMSGECHFVGLTKEMIFGKQREIIHTKCKSEDIEAEQDEYIAEGLGVYKTILKTDTSFEDVEHHSVMTTLLETYE